MVKAQAFVTERLYGRGLFIKERLKSEVDQGLILNKTSGLPEGFFLDTGCHTINGKQFWISVQVLP